MKYDELVDHIEDGLNDGDIEPRHTPVREVAEHLADWLTTETELFVNRAGELDFRDADPNDALPTSTGPGGSSEHVPGT